MATYEIPLSQDIDEAPAPVPFEVIDASLITTFRHKKLAAPLVEEFRRQPARFIQGFEEIELSTYQSKAGQKNYFLGRVPSSEEEGEWKTVSATLFSPGRVVKGLHKVARLIRPETELSTTLQIESRPPFQLPVKQLPLFQ